MSSAAERSVPARRSFLRGAGLATLSASAVALLAGRESLAQGMKPDPAKDVGILNFALGLEHEAIAAYQIGAESKLLKQPVLGVAVLFQSHHKEHRDALAATIQKMGGAPVAAKANAEYAKALNAGMIKTDKDILTLAMRLELGAANAYLGVIPSFGNAELAKVAARLAADETMQLDGAAYEPGHETARQSADLRSVAPDVLASAQPRRRRSSPEIGAGGEYHRIVRPC